MIGMRTGTRSLCHMVYGVDGIMVCEKPFLASSDQAPCKATYFESINLGSSDLLAIHRDRQGRTDRSTGAATCLSEAEEVELKTLMAVIRKFLLPV